MDKPQETWVLVKPAADTLGQYVKEIKPSANATRFYFTYVTDDALKFASQGDADETRARNYDRLRYFTSERVKGAQDWLYDQYEEYDREYAVASDEYHTIGWDEVQERRELKAILGGKMLMLAKFKRSLQELSEKNLGSLYKHVTW